MVTLYFFVEILTKIYDGQCIGVKGIVYCYVSGHRVYSNYIQRITLIPGKRPSGQIQD